MKPWEKLVFRGRWLIYIYIHIYIYIYIHTYTIHIQYIYFDLTDMQFFLTDSVMFWGFESLGEEDELVFALEVRSKIVWAAVQPVPSWYIKSTSARLVRPGTFQTACWQAVSSDWRDVAVGGWMSYLALQALQVLLAIQAMRRHHLDRVATHPHPRKPLAEQPGIRDQGLLVKPRRRKLFGLLAGWAAMQRFSWGPWFLWSPDAKGKAKATLFQSFGLRKVKRPRFQ